MKKGLLPFQTSNWVKGANKDRYNEEGGIFAFEHPRDAFGWAFKMQWDHNKPTSIVRIRAGDAWDQDPSQDPNLIMGKGKALVSRGMIKPQSIVDSFELKSFGTPGGLGISQDEWYDRIEKALQS